MPAVSQRAREMPPSPIRKLVPHAEAARARGVRVYNLNIGQPDIESPREFLDAYRQHELKILPYGHSAGLWEYREELVKYYARHGVSVRSSEIVVTTGGSEAILFALGLVGDAGDEVIVPEPFYTNYNGFAVQAGIRLVPVTRRIEDGFALPPRSEFEKRIGPKTRAILVSNPCNPTGRVLSAGEMNLLRDLVVEHDLFLLADEVYREFVFDGAKAISSLCMPALSERAIMLDSISKRYSVCGARVGCIVTHNQQFLDAALRLGQARLCPPTMEQHAAARAIHAPPEYLAGVVEEYRRRRDAIFEEIPRIPGAFATPPAGAFYAMVRLPIADADDFCRWLLSDFSFEKETVMLAPGAGFYATAGLGRDEVRLAYVLNVEALRRAMVLLRRGLEAYPGRK